MSSNSSRPNEASRPHGTQHRPANPSGLRQAHMPPSSPEDRRNNSVQEQGMRQPTDGGIQPVIEGASMQSEPSNMYAEGAIEEPEANARTKLLGDTQKYSIGTHDNCGEENCNHGNISPRPRHHRGYGSFAPSIMSTDGTGGSYTEGGVGSSADSINGILGDALADSLMPRGGPEMSTTQYLAQRKKVKSSKLMYVGLPVMCISSFHPVSRLRPNQD